MNSTQDKSEKNLTVENEIYFTENERNDNSWFERLKTRIGLGPANLRDDLEVALEADEQNGEHFSPEERAMLRNILKLREMRVDDVMIPRADIDAVESSISLSALLTAFHKSGHSRMPVHGNTLDDPMGMVHIKDLMTYIAETAIKSGENNDKEIKTIHTNYDLGIVDLSKSLTDIQIIRPVLFIPPSMPATDLLANMQARRIQMALVIDEYGGTDGLVSLEDVVEIVVGDIEDEHDGIEGPLIINVGEGIYIADARANLDEVADILGAEFNTDEHAEDVDTLGGLVFSLLERIPVRSELIVQFPGFEFEILDADARRIKKLKIYRSGMRAPTIEGKHSGRIQTPPPTSETTELVPTQNLIEYSSPEGTVTTSSTQQENNVLVDTPSKKHASDTKK